MLRLPEFQVHQPVTLEDAVRLHTTLPDARYLAGGTDLLPNLKHELDRPQHLIALGGVSGLVGVEEIDGGALRVGALTPLQDVADSAIVRARVPALAEAAGLVAGPQHRRMGTLGGNVMLDTRCLYYNQTFEWRTALGFCLKRDGDWCHVIDSPKRCVAAQSSDTVPVLVAVDAVVEFMTAEGPHALPVGELYQQDGRVDRMHNVPPGALLTAVRVPNLPDGLRSTYRKVRTRDAVDFPQLAIAITAALDPEDGRTIRSLCVVIGAMLPKPKRFDLRAFVGRPLDDATIEAIAQEIHARTAPQTNLHGDPEWRRHMARVETARGLRALRDA
jgi:4-hydroxybenzoyl-CoA reductase subunit beta